MNARLIELPERLDDASQSGSLRLVFVTMPWLVFVTVTVPNAGLRCFPLRS